MNIKGIHHITAISGPAQSNYDFYTRTLGLRFVKKTINFDDPGTYHLYYGDKTGSPGTLLTFFPFPRTLKGRAGAGMAHRITFAVPEAGFSWWADYLSKKNLLSSPPFERFERPVLPFRDTDGLSLEIIPLPGIESTPGWDQGIIPEEHAIRFFAGATLFLDQEAPTISLLKIMGYELMAEERGFYRFKTSLSAKNKKGEAIAEDSGNLSGQKNDGREQGRNTSFSAPLNYEDAAFPASFLDIETGAGSNGRSGSGTIHHIAFRVADENEQIESRNAFLAAGMKPTEIINRKYFKSIYFREPGGVLFEIATDPPGMNVDEDINELGAKLQLPPWYESNRDAIVRALPQLKTDQTVKL